jgi:hypothetical protein
MATRHYFSDKYYAGVTTEPLDNSETGIDVDTITNLPTSFPFWVALDLTNSSREVVQVNSITSLTLNVDRGQGGTSAVTHATGCSVRLVVSKDFFDTVYDIDVALDRYKPIYVIKSTLESVTSSAVLQDDDELFVDLEAGRTYHINAVIAVSGATTGDIQTAWSNTGTMSLPSGGRTCFGYNASEVWRSGTATLGGARTYGLPAGTTWLEEKFIVNCTVAGRLKFRWAQQTSDATATNVASGSYIIAAPLV